MKILVFSDTHGCRTYMCRAIEYERPDYIIHLGDHTSDAQFLKECYPALPVVQVRGNCDYDDWSTPEERLVNYDGIRVFAVHGHRYGVKTGLLRLYYAAKEKAVHIVLWGHTHCAYCEERDGIWLMNPGACSMRGAVTYGLITSENGSTVCTIKSADERND